MVGIAWPTAASAVAASYVGSDVPLTRLVSGPAPPPTFAVDAGPAEAVAVPLGPMPRIRRAAPAAKITNRPATSSHRPLLFDRGGASRARRRAARVAVCPARVAVCRDGGAATATAGRSGVLRRRERLMVVPRWGRGRSERRQLVRWRRPG